MTTTSVKKAVGNIADSVWYAVRDSYGYMNGATETAPAAGDADGSAMAQLKGVSNFPFQPVDPDMPAQKGDGGVLTRFINKPTNQAESDMVFGSSDYDFHALVQSLKVVTFGGGRFVLNQPQNPVYRNMILMAVAPANSMETATLDTGLWEARIVLNSYVFSKGRNAFNTDGLPTYGHKAVANNAACYPWGHAFSDADEGDTAAAFVEFYWPYKPIIQRWTGNNSMTSFNLAYAIAEDSADNIVVFVDGVEKTWVTGAPAASQFGITAGTPDALVLGDTIADGAKLLALYGKES